MSKREWELFVEDIVRIYILHRASFYCILRNLINGCTLFNHKEVLL